jgi:hypothetical protein
MPLPPASAVFNRDGVSASWASAMVDRSVLRGRAQEEIYEPNERRLCCSNALNKLLQLHLHQALLEWGQPTGGGFALCRCKFVWVQT